MASFSTSLSGLNAEEQALSVISNDLSNLNTTAFKTQTPIFSDLFYQMLGADGAGDPVQVGVGSTMSSVAAPITQGNIATTGVPTDVAIQGNGLFILDHGGTQVYSRAGNFTLNPHGNLVDSSGNNVLGYAALNGAINTSQSLSPIVISSGKNYSPSATTQVEFDMNLDATDTSLVAATGTLTVPAPVLPTAGQTANIGGTTYTFVGTSADLTGANDVLIGADAQSTLANLAGAINAASTLGQGAGVTYGPNTVHNASVNATATASTLNLQAINTGAAGNSLPTSTPWTGGSFGAADLAGGVDNKQATGTLSVPPPLPTAGQTVTIGGTTYTFSTAISAQSPADTVLIDPTGSVQKTLANLAGAINLSSTNGQAAGATYSSTTVANGTVKATGSTATTLSLQALNSGLAGDQDATTSQWTAGAFGGANLGGGQDPIPATATFTVPAAALPNAGDTIAIGGTTYTFQATLHPGSPADTVLIDPAHSVQQTLTNLAGAINLSSSNGQGAGTTYSSATVLANASVSASNPTGTSLTFTATAANSGTMGDIISATSASWGATQGVFQVTDLSGGATGVSASAILTVPATATVPNPGDTITIGGTTYTFANSVAGAPADTVLIDQTASVANTLANLAAAMGLGAGAGTTYSSLTVLANASVNASNPTANTLTLTAAQTGAGGNSTPVSTNWTGALFGGGALAGGVDAVMATGTFSVSLPTPTAGQTVAVGGTTYTFATSLNAAPADTVLIDSTSVRNTLSNLMAAVNADPSKSGVSYSSATANSSVVASNPTASSLTLTAVPVGAAGNNSIATLTNWTGGSFGAADLMGGVNAQAAAGNYTLPVALPTTGQTAIVGSTTYTFVAAAGLTAADTVLIGTDVQSTLANLAGAINGSSANGQGAGATYGTGTAPNTSVTAMGSTATTLTLQAIQAGAVGDTLATSTTWTTGTFGTGDLAGGTDAGKFSDSITVYDSLGDSHVLSFNFSKASPGDWNYQITIPAADVGATGNPQVVASGTLQFDASGNLITPSADVTAIKINGLTDGASSLTFNWQLYNSSRSPVITQTAETSATSGKNQDGFSSGTLQSYNIESSGIISGVLSNTQTVSLGQIALATFPNYDGLTRIGSNNYQSSLASGAASVGIPGGGGRGTLKGNSLEQSNVDIATEFTALIQAERGYQANAKAITTADSLMQTAINLKQ